jgi:hypothetical protein
MRNCPFPGAMKTKPNKAKANVKIGKSFEVWPIVQRPAKRAIENLK